MTEGRIGIAKRIAQTMRGFTVRKDGERDLLEEWRGKNIRTGSILAWIGGFDVRKRHPGKE
jgi:hypothetical protein